MGRLINNTNHNYSKKRKSLTKGQRLGWSHQSDCEYISLCSLSSHGENLSTYTTGPFSVNKLVP